MDKSLILFPSVQPNRFKGQSITEGQYCKAVCDAAKPLLEAWGWSVAMPWAYDANGDLHELTAQRQEGQALQAISKHLVLSVHCDWTGTTKKDGVLMIYRATRPADKVWAEAFGRLFGELTTLGYKGTVDESYTSVKRLGIMAVPGPNILVEIGEFGTTAEAVWLLAYRGKVALALAQSIEQSAHDIYGTALYTGDDDMTPDQDKLLKLARVSDVARSADAEIIKALIKGEMGKAAALELEKARDVAAEKARLGV